MVYSKKVRQVRRSTVEHLNIQHDACLSSTDSSGDGKCVADEYKDN